MSALSPARITVRELAQPTMRRVTREWRVLPDGVETDYTIIQPEGDWAEGGYQVATSTMVLLGVRTFGGSLAYVANLLGAL